MAWRIGSTYGIHVYEGNRPVATFHDEREATLAVGAVNVALASADRLEIRRLRRQLLDAADHCSTLASRLGTLAIPGTQRSDIAKELRHRADYIRGALR